MDASRAVAIYVAITCIAVQRSALADSSAALDNLRGSRHLQHVADNDSVHENNHTGPMLSEPGNDLPPGSLNVCEGDW